MTRPRLHNGAAKAAALLLAVLLCFGLLPHTVQAAPGQQAAPGDAYTFMPALSSAVPSVADVRKLVLDGPAGRYGFVQARDGHFVLEDTGERIRFWGVNMVFSANFPSTRQKAEALAEDFASMGINLVRLHGIDSANGERHTLFKDYQNSTRQLDADQLDKLDYFIYALKQRGIYINLNLNSKRQYTAGDGVADPKLVSSTGRLKAAQMFDETLIALQKEFIQSLMDHKNPYTGLTYAAEPAIAMLELLNETSLYSAWINDILDRDMTAHYAEQLETLWNGWLKDTYATSAALQASWGGTVAAFGGIPLPRRANINTAETQKYSDFGTFLYTLEKAYFDEMSRFLKQQVGAKQPVSGSNQYMGAGHIASQSRLDFTNIHAYYDHPVFPNGWSYDNFTMQQSSLVVDGGNAELKNNKTLFAQMSMTAVKGKPHVVSEWNLPYPNAYEYEALLLAAAVGNLQDWDAMILFAYSHSDKAGTGQIEDWFDLKENPVKRAQMGTAALLFTRGDLGPAHAEWVMDMAWEDALKSSLVEVYSYQWLSGRQLPPSLVYSTRLRYGNVQADKTAAPPKDLPGSGGGTLHSGAKGAFVWDVGAEGAEYVKINSKRMQAFIGFVGGEKYSAENLTVALDEGCEGAVSLVSMDGKVLQNSASMLLTVGGGQYSQGQQLNQNGGLANWGTGPMKLLQLTGSVTLRVAQPQTHSVYPLAANGSRLPALPVVRGNSDITFNLSAATPWYEIAADGGPQESGEPFLGLALNRTSLELAVGDSFTLQPLALQGTLPKKLEWQVEKGNGVITVTDGQLQAQQAGVATVTVYNADNKSQAASCVVTVKQPGAAGRPATTPVPLSHEVLGTAPGVVYLYGNGQMTETLPLAGLELDNGLLTIPHTGAESLVKSVGVTGATLRQLAEKAKGGRVLVAGATVFCQLPTDIAALEKLATQAGAKLDEVVLVLEMQYTDDGAASEKAIAAADARVQRTSNTVRFSLQAYLPNGTVADITKHVPFKAGITLGQGYNQHNAWLAAYHPQSDTGALLSAGYIQVNGRWGFEAPVVDGAVMMTLGLKETAGELLIGEDIPLADPGAYQVPAALSRLAPAWATLAVVALAGTALAIGYRRRRRKPTKPPQQGK